MNEDVLYSVDGRVATITLNRPGQRNAINGAVAAQLEAALTTAEQDDEIWVVLLTGAGPAFCAGADLVAIAAGGTDQLSTALGGFAGFVRYPRTKPVIAAVHGFALAGGWELVLACDLVVAAHATRFGLPEVTRGILAAAGGIYRLSQALPSARARELILTGDPITADEALALGLVNRVVDLDQVLATARALADRLCQNAPLAVRASLRLSREARELTEEESWHRTDAAAAQIRQTHDAHEGPQAFAEKREPCWSAH